MDKVFDEMRHAREESAKPKIGTVEIATAIGTALTGVAAIAVPMITEMAKAKVESAKAMAEAQARSADGNKGIYDALIKGGERNEGLVRTVVEKMTANDPTRALTQMMSGFAQVTSASMDTMTKAMRIAAQASMGDKNSEVSELIQQGIGTIGEGVKSVFAPPALATQQALPAPAATPAAASAATPAATPTENPVPLVDEKVLSTTPLPALLEKVRSAAKRREVQETAGRLVEWADMARRWEIKDPIVDGVFKEREGDKVEVDLGRVKQIVMLIVGEGNPDRADFAEKVTAEVKRIVEAGEERAAS